MKRAISVGLVGLLGLAGEAWGVGGEDGPAVATPMTNVKIRGGFWGDRQAVVRDATAAANIAQCQKTGRIENFELAAKPTTGDAPPGGFHGLLFNDSDVDKVLEGLADVYATEPETAKRESIKKTIDAWVVAIAAAQRPDGYVDTYYQLKEGIDKRWTREQWNHESYCMGHLIEAAVAHHQATGESSLLDVAIRAADHIASVFQPGKLTVPSGHEEIELSLVKLANEVGIESERGKKYVGLAKFFLDQRGREHRELSGSMEKPWGDYAQDTVPLGQQTEAMGHAVRAGYLYSAMTDVQRLDPASGYDRALHRIWRDLTERKMYVTGGIGPSAHNEGFTAPYDLPNESAYSETCASISLCLWAHRMFLLERDGAYMDVFERTLHNAVLAGLSLDGSKFFYVNPLASKGNHHRQDWFECACCPPNVLRFLAGLGGYAYASAGDEVYVNLFVPGEAVVNTAHGPARIWCETEYPFGETVRLKLSPPKGGMRLAVRVPAWCEGAKLSMGGKPQDVKVVNGYFTLPIIAMTDVELTLPMPVSRVHADSRVTSCVGRVALQRGPIMYAVEGMDVTSSPTPVNMEAAVLPLDGEIKVEAGSVKGVKAPLLAGTLWMFGERGPGALYASSGLATPAKFRAIPYFAWDNRGSTSMAVWLAESPSVLPISHRAKGIAASASHIGNGDGVGALCDGIDPADSNDHSVPRFTWWSHLGTKEWVQYDFQAPRKVSSVDVYWFDDGRIGANCRVPASWQVLYKDGEDWKPVKAASGYGVELDKFMHVDFETVTTRALRLDVQLQKGWSAGVLEWKVE